MNKKLDSMGLESSLKDFTMEAPTDSVYQFEGEDYRLVFVFLLVIIFNNYYSQIINSLLIE